MPHYDVFYMKPDFFIDGIMGVEWCQKKGRMPNPRALSSTHAYVKMTEADSLQDLFHKMQGEVWSPNGEAREVIEKAGLQHTSMSMGDIAVAEDGTVSMVDRYGFKTIGETYEP